MRSKKAQEEMLGFVLIVGLVVIALIFVLLIYLNQPVQSQSSYSVDSFIQAGLQYTSNCSNYLGPFSIQDLIYECVKNDNCNDGQNSCRVLNSTLRGIAAASWNVVNGSSTKGYLLNISSEGKEVIFFSNGNLSSSSQGSIETLPRGISVQFKVYN